uniref:Uncharacterized protein n=1 Tax=Rhizophora mucronata TaxID=61149 RepID=A0A2P2PHX4_RHIMU
MYMYLLFYFLWEMVFCIRIAGCKAEHLVGMIGLVLYQNALHCSCT